MAESPLPASDLIPAAPAPPPGPTRTFWQRRVIDPVLAQLTQGITPEKIALTIAVGSALALFPMLGVTTLFCFLAGIVLRLNQPIIQVVNYLCTPIHIPLIFYCLHLGEKLFGVPHTRIRLGEFAKLVWDDPILFAHKFGLTVLHATVVWAIAAPVWIAVMYFTARTTLREIARVRAEAAARAAALVAPKVTDTTDHPVP